MFMNEPGLNCRDEALTPELKYKLFAPGPGELNVHFFILNKSETWLQ